MTITGQDLVTAALREIKVVNAVDPPTADDAAYVLGVLNRILDGWNVEARGATSRSLDTYTLTPGLNPHTIGPSGATWTAARPVTILAANLIQGTTRTALAVHHDSWRTTLSDPTFAGSPTDLDYEADTPSGSVYLYPVPDAADSIELLVQPALSAITLDAELSLAPGYQAALELTAAEQCAESFGSVVTPMLERNARQARARIFGQNSRIPSLSTTDAGMGGTRSAFDYTIGR